MFVVEMRFRLPKDRCADTDALDAIVEGVYDWQAALRMNGQI